MVELFALTSRQESQSDTVEQPLAFNLNVTPNNCLSLNLCDPSLIHVFLGPYSFITLCIKGEPGADEE